MGEETIGVDQLAVDVDLAERRVHVNRVVDGPPSRSAAAGHAAKVPRHVPAGEARCGGVTCSLIGEWVSLFASLQTLVAYSRVSAKLLSSYASGAR